jgi:NitT/TauT family transport system substrate-binding protein
VTATSCDNQPQASVKIGYLPVYSNLPLFVAAEEGFFSQNGIKTELIRFESSPTIATALVNGDIDMAGNVAYPSVLSIESRDPGKLKIYLVSAHTKQDYLSSIVTMPNSGIFKVEDLRGKTVGIFPGPSAGVFFGLLFEKHGLNPKTDINLVELDSNLELDALTSGKVDALATFEPISTQAVLQIGAVNILPAAIETEVVEPWHGGASVITAKYIDENPEMAKRVIESLYLAVDFIRQNPTRAKETLTKYTGIPSAMAQKIPNPAFQKIGEMNLKTLQEQADMLQINGVLTKKIDLTELLLDLNILR